MRNCEGRNVNLRCSVCSVNNVWLKGKNSGGCGWEAVIGMEKPVQEIALDGLVCSIPWKTLLFSVTRNIYVEDKCTEYCEGEEGGCKLPKDVVQEDLCIGGI